MGNVNWMRARESQLASELFGSTCRRCMPIVRPGGSDSATFDNVLELLMLAGRSLPHAAMMMIPEAYAGPRRPARLPQGLLRLPRMSHGAVGRPAVGRVHRRHASSARRSIRNGLRPGRWVETKDGHVILGSEAGMLRIGGRPTLKAPRSAWPRASSSSSTSRRAGIVEDEEVKRQVATQRPLRPVGRRQRRGTSTTCHPRRRAARTSRCAPCSSRSATRRRTCAC
jgi:glutamate synthase (NADPH/NADH) large chain/glutamate synthase (ferredoxin)